MPATGAERELLNGAVGAPNVRNSRPGRRLTLVVFAAVAMLLGALVSPVAAAAPDAPVIDPVTPSGLVATINWTAPAANGTTISGYVVSLSPSVPGSPKTIAAPATSTSFSGLAPGTSYTVTVVAESDDEDSPPGSRTFETAAAPATAPTGAPTGVTVSQVGTTTSATVSWTAVPVSGNGGSAITSYQVRANGAGAWSTLANGGTVTGLDVGPNTVAVRAVNAVGPGPAASGSVTIDPPPPAATEPTGAPTGVTVSQVGTTTSATVSWTAVPVSGNGGSAITSYQVRANGDGAWSTLANGGTVTGLDVGPNTVAVRAVNAVGPGPAASGSVTIDPPPPAATEPTEAPTAVVIRDGGAGRIEIGFAGIAAAGNGGSPVTKYQVRLNDTGGWSDVPGGAGADSWTSGVLAPGTYTARVRAVNAVGNGPASSASGPFDLFVTPSAVRNVAITGDGTATVTVTWAAPADDGGGLLDYQITLSPTVAGVPVQVVELGDPRTVTFSGLPAGNYTVQVRARNAGGLSPGGTATFRIVVEPGVPRNVRGTNGIRTTTITWEPPADNGGGTISGYQITVAGKFREVGAADRAATFDIPIGKFTAEVRAINARGLSLPGVSPEFESVRPVDPFETREAFARQAYRDLFDVNATPGEVAALAARTAADGANAPVLLAEMMRSSRFDARRRVARLYFAYFGRVPDAGGQMYWTELMESGRLDLQGVSDEFARSQEFQNTYGGFDEAQFIVLVYNNVLGRTPDQPGFLYWLDQRNRGLSRGGVMTWFTEGQEYINRSLAGVETSLAHIMMLDRSPSAGEYADWVNRMNSRTADLITLSYDLYASDEYAARVTP